MKKDETVWFLTRTKNKETCEHSHMIPMTPIREVPSSKTMYDVLLSEVCADCGITKERKIGVSSYGNASMVSFM